MLHSDFTLSGQLSKILDYAAEKPQNLGDTDHQHMALALEQAMMFAGRAYPNPTVGCVVVDRNQQIIGRGATESYRGLHAETSAIASVKNPDLLKGATLYSTLEPCNHDGNQPPCTEAILEAGISRCVYGSGDDNPAVAGGGASRLKEAGIELGRSLAAECEAFHQPFLYSAHTKKPYFALKWAQTIDGHLYDDTKKSQWITGEMSRIYAHWLRSFYDEILVGAGTVISDQPKLTNRDAKLIPRQPKKIIFDPSCRIASQMNPDDLSETLQNSTVVTAGPKLVSPWYRSLVAEEVSLQSKDFGEFLAYLESRSPASIMVEGGPALLNLFLKKGSYQAAHCFIAPTILGGTKGKIGQSLTDPAKLGDSRPWQLTQSKALGPDTLIEALNRPAN